MFLAGVTVAVLGAVAVPAGGRRGLSVAGAVAGAVAAAGVVAAVTAVVLAGTGTLDRDGMIAIPALHDAASDRPITFTPVCSHTAIPVCLNPAYAGYLPAAAATLRPVLAEIVGLPGAPIRISQAAASYLQGPGNLVTVGLTGPQVRDGEYRMLLPDQLNGPSLTIAQLAEQVRITIGPAIVSSFVSGGQGASEAQQAVAAALSTDAGLPAATVSLGPPLPRGRTVHTRCDGGTASCSTGGVGRPKQASPVYAAARRFGALPLAARRAWLAQHLTALRAGQITLAELP
jgi:hypothetical protein